MTGLGLPQLVSDASLCGDSSPHRTLISSLDWAENVGATRPIPPENSLASALLLRSRRRSDRTNQRNDVPRAEAKRHRLRQEEDMENLNGLKVAILVENGFEWVELVEPRKALDQAGAETRIVSPRDQRVKGWKFTEWGDELPADVALDQALARNFDALLLPGGVMNPDALRMQPKAVAFVKSFFDAGKPVAVICHGPWTVIEAGAAKGRRIASWPSLKTDLRNAGAEWIDREVVVDNNLVSSRKPDDIPAFNREMIKQFGGARDHARQTA